MGNDNNRPTITIEVDEADKNQFVKSIAVIKRPLHSSSSQSVVSSEAVQNRGFMHHWILIELENQRKYNIESLAVEYKISPVTNDQLSEIREATPFSLSQTNITLEEFYKKSFDGVRQYHPTDNNCIHFVKKIIKIYFPVVDQNCWVEIIKYTKEIIVDVLFYKLSASIIAKYGPVILVAGSLIIIGGALVYFAKKN